MLFIELTKPDGLPIMVNMEQVPWLEPCGQPGSLTQLCTTDRPDVFTVKESPQQIMKMINATLACQKLDLTELTEDEAIRISRIANKCQSP